jgi:hypothetical protein
VTPLDPPIIAGVRFVVECMPLLYFLSTKNVGVSLCICRFLWFLSAQRHGRL